VYINTKKSVEADMRRAFALKNSEGDAENMKEVLEALASGDTSMQDVEMNDKHPLEGMHAAAQSSKEGGRMDEGSQMPEDSQDFHACSQQDLQLIPEGGKEDEHGKMQPMVESSSDEEDEDEDEDADEDVTYDYHESYGHAKEAGAWQEPAKKKRKIETKLSVLKAK
jgi:hypothetical protein